MGAYIVLVHQQKWLFLLCCLLFVIWLLFSSREMNSRRLCLFSILVFILSISYNLWFDGRNHTSFEFDPFSEYQVQGKIASSVSLDGDRVSIVIKEMKYAEKIQVFIRLHSLLEQQEAKQLKRGDNLFIKGEFKKPEAARNFDMFEYGVYLYHQQIHWIVQVDGLDQIQVFAKKGFNRYVLWSWTDQIRKRIGDKVAVLYDDAYSGFMKSLLIGLRDDLQPDQFQQFASIGLTHIMAISGLHVAVFIAGCMGLMKVIGISRETNQLIMILVLPIYMLLTGAAPSVIRAGIMAMLALIALRRKKLKDGLHIISTAAILMLIYNPYYLFQISFQLSFIVTLGLIVFVPIFNRLLPIHSLFLKSTLSVTTVAQLVSFPLTIYYFNQFSLLSWVANLILVPLASIIIIPLGLISLSLGFIFFPLSKLLAQINERIVYVLFSSIQKLNEFSLFIFIWASPSSMWIILYFIFLALIFWLIQNHQWYKKSIEKIVISLAVGGLILHLLFAYHSDYLDRIAVVHFLDVGQGDAAFIVTPEKKTILIDGGGTLHFRREGEEWRNRRDPYEVGKNLLVPLLKKRGVQSIDYLIVTHAHLDHYGGLQAVIEQIPVRNLFFNGTLRDQDRFTLLLTTALERNIPIYMAQGGKSIHIDSHTELKFLYPLVEQDLHYVEAQNQISVVHWMKIYDTTLLFTGDMESQSEKELLEHLMETPSSNKVDILKVAHHGSRTSTTQEWIQYWQPKLAIIPVGRFNSYGHPHPTVVERIQSAGSALYRTDFHGEVQLKIDKNHVDIRTKLVP